MWRPPDDVHGELAELDALTRRVSEAESAVAARRHTVASESGKVTVVVAGDGRLLDLTLDRDALRGSHVSRLAAEITATITHARDVADQRSAEEMRTLVPEFGGAR